MKQRKRYYATTTGHAAGIDIAIRSPDRRVIGTVIGLSVFDDGGGIEQAKADAGMIVAALNAYARQQRI